MSMHSFIHKFSVGGFSLPNLAVILSKFSDVHVPSPGVHIVCARHQGHSVWVQDANQGCCANGLSQLAHRTMVALILYDNLSSHYPFPL